MRHPVGRRRRLVPASLRPHLKRNGEAKVKFSKVEALAKAERHCKNAYCCDVCGQWHIGGRADP